MNEKTYTTAQLDYWGDRFRRLHVAGLCGCTFEQYLRRPAYYEGIAEARQHLALSRARTRARAHNNNVSTNQQRELP